jgi:Domain of unknown function (DUF4157)
MQVRVREDSWVAKMAAAKLRSSKVAIVIGKTIHLHNTSKEEFIADREWVCHELKHVEQYQKHGTTMFLVLYLVEWIRKGYYKNRFEIEARNSEKDLALLNEIKIG